MTILYTDGGCRGNEQKDMRQREMFLAVTDAAGQVLYQDRRPGGSNNIAELAAVVEAAKWCLANAVPAPIEIRTDSRNNLSWANGGKVGKGINDRPAVLGLQLDLAAYRVPFRLVWVPREENVAGQYLEGVYGV